MASAAAASTPPSVQDDGALSHKQIVTILIGLMMGMFLAALDQTIVATAIRTIADDLQGPRRAGLGDDGLPDHLDDRRRRSTASCPTSTGARSCSSSRSRSSCVGSMLCTFATSMPELAAFRAVQGLGAGGLFSLALAIIGDIVPPRERAKYQGYFLAVFGTSSVLGPVIGGFFAGQATHPRHRRLALGLPRQRADRHRRAGRRHAAPCTCRTPASTTASTGGAPPRSPSASCRCCSSPSRAAIWGWDSGRSIACYVIGVIGVVAFVARRAADGRRGADPAAALPEPHGRDRLDRLRHPRHGHVRRHRLRCRSTCRSSRAPRPTQAGLLLLPMTLGIMSGSIVSGQIISRTGRYRHFPIIGSALLVLVAVRVPLRRRRHPAVADHDRHGRLRPRARLQHAAADPRRAERRLAAGHRRRHVVGDVHPADRRHARHRGLPVDPVLGGAGPSSRRPSARIAPSPDFQAALKATQGNAAANHAFISGLQGAQSGGSGGAFDGALNDSSFIQQLDPPLAQPFLVGFSESIDLVFLVGSGVMVVGLRGAAVPAQRRAAQRLVVRRARPHRRGGRRGCDGTPGDRPLTGAPR